MPNQYILLVGLIKFNASKVSFEPHKISVDRSAKMRNPLATNCSIDKEVALAIPNYK